MKIAASLFLALLLSACIIVDDFGEYWAKGKTDRCINDLLYASMHADDASVEMKAITQTVRVIQFGGQDFIMMLNKPGSQDGNLIRYRIDGSEYVSYKLSEEKREQFLREHPHTSVVVTNDTVTIPQLNKETASLLGDIAGDNSYWTEASREPYNPKHRTDCLHK